MFCKFVFDGISCDEYGVVCVSFENNNMTTTDSQKTDLNYEKSISGTSYNIISQEYSDPITYTIQIINKNGNPITQIQERALKKWLCKRNTYKKFCILNKRYADIWFFVNINNPKNIWVNDVNAMEFTVTTNSPIAFSDERNNTYIFDANDEAQIYINNDEEMPIFPSMIITALESGNLEITNKTLEDIDANILKINNLKNNEVITIDSNYPIIESSDTSHNNNIYNDCNKQWFYFIDGYNTVHVNKPCKIQFIYREYRKVGMS